MNIIPDLKVVIISLTDYPNRKEKLSHILDVFDNIKLNYSFYSGADARFFEIENKNNSIIIDNKYHIKENKNFKYFDIPLTYGDIGCYISHIELYNMLTTDNKYNRYLILEDNFLLMSNIDYFINCLSNLPIIFDICYLTKTKNNISQTKYNNIFSTISKNIVFNSSCGYIISKNGAINILGYVNTDIYCSMNELLTYVCDKTNLFMYVSSYPVFTGYKDGLSSIKSVNKYYEQKGINPNINIPKYEKDILVLYCKTYIKDKFRVKSLADSIEKYNKDNLKFYISAPKNDMEEIKKLNIKCTQFINDEDIYIIEGKIGGWFEQQIVKASFWKLGLCKNYVCIDSDSYFIKDFRFDDFMVDNDTPYTIMHENKDLHEWSLHNLKIDIISYPIKEKNIFMKLFNRKNNKLWEFGPTPAIWSCKVWELIDENIIKLNKTTFQNLLLQYPSELTWYGEALLHYKPFSIYPLQSLFKVFHYYEQYIQSKEKYTEEDYKKLYFGLVVQSNYKFYNNNIDDNYFNY